MPAGSSASTGLPSSTSIVIAELRQDDHGDYVAVLRDQTEIRVGRRFRVRLQARLGQQL